MSLTKDGFFKQLGSTIGSNNYLLQAAGGHIAWGNGASQIPYSNGTVNTNLNADMVDGLHVHSSRNNEANKIVRTDGSGYIQAGWINTSSGNMGTSAIDRIYVSNDGFIRYKTKKNFANELRDSGYLDGRYLKLSGGTMSLGEGLQFHADENYFGTNLDARIISLLDGNGTTCDGGLIIDERATSNGNTTITELLRIRDNEFKWKGNTIWHVGNLTKVSQLTNDKGYVTSSGVTSITLKAGAGISLDVDNTAITSTGTRTITNAGVRAVTINGNYLRVNTNGTNADLTIPYATNADKVDGYHISDSQLYNVVKSLTMTTVNTIWYLKIMLSGYAQPDHIFITCSYNNKIDRAHIYFTGMSHGYIYRNNNQNQGNIKAIALKTVYDSTEHTWIFYLKFDKIYNSSDQYYSPSSSTTVSVYTLTNSAFDIAIETTEPSGITWVETGDNNNNLIIKNATLYGNASTATSATNSTNVYIEGASGDVNYPLLFTPATANGNSRIYTDSQWRTAGITFNPSSNTLKVGNRITAPYANYTQTSMRHLDAGLNSVSTDHTLYIGYGAQTYTAVTHFYYSTGTTDTTSSRTEFMQINSNGAYALTRFGVNGQNTSYNLYVNGTSMFTNTLNLRDSTNNAGSGSMIYFNYDSNGNASGTTVRIYRYSDVFYITRGGSSTTGITMNASGYVSLGAAPSSSYRLYVSGPSMFNGIINIDSNTMGGVTHINFNRASYNYINIPTGGTFAVSVTTAGSSNSRLAVNATNVFPGENNNLVSLGTTSYRWKSIYTVDEYIGTTSGSQCHLNFDNTNKCLRFTFD